MLKTLYSKTFSVTKSVMLMFDTVNMRLARTEVAGVDFLSETPCYLDDGSLGEHSYPDGLVITGTLDNLNVSLSKYQVKVRDGSLCKWYLGDNYQTMGRKDTQKAFEKLSDTLHLPMDKATITRLDVAHNFIVRYPIDVYFNHLGVLKNAARLIEPYSLYYRKCGMRLAFYDKNREQKANREPIPDLYNGRNVLRYEQRYTQRVASQLNVFEVTGKDLYDEAFYMSVLSLWWDSYKNIQKINDVSLNFQAMKTKRDLYRMGVLSLIGLVGGQLALLDQIAEAQKKGELTAKQALDLRRAVQDACKEREGLSVPNDAIQELDKKVAEAVRFYR